MTRTNKIMLITALLAASSLLVGRIFRIDDHQQDASGRTEVSSPEAQRVKLGAFEWITADSMSQTFHQQIAKARHMPASNMADGLPVLDRKSAIAHLGVNLSMAWPPTKGVETADAYLFSGGTSAHAVNDFSQGVGISKSDGSIFFWDLARLEQSTK